MISPVSRAVSGTRLVRALAAALPLLCAAGATGCASAVVEGPVDLAGRGATSDGAMARDLGAGVAEDLAAAPGSDLAVAAAGDLAAAPDLALPAASDLALPAPADLVALADLAARPDMSCPGGGTLKIGDTYSLDIDSFTGDLEAAQPKVDKNDGKGGDNPYFLRTNVTYAHVFNNIGYWYSSSHQNPGDPDPKGSQWVDYRPPLGKLGSGRYRITAEYRQSANRASYDALYIINHRAGATTVKRKQTVGVEFTTFDLGDFDLGCTGWVRVQDPGAESITFDRMFFKYLGP